jgi:N utilization substance protein A
MKGSRVQSIIKELRGEKIDIIEWSEEPSIFAANALSPAKVNKVNITNIEKKQMEVIVNEDQLSLAIGKRGQNVRLATKLVGWNIDIRSEEELKKEIALQMGNLIASGEAVPLAAIGEVSAAQAETLEEHGITDIETLAAVSVDDLVDFLDISLDEAESIINSAKAVMNVAATSANPAEEAANEEQPAGQVEITEEVSTAADIEETPVTTADETVEIDENLHVESEDAALAREDISTAPDEVVDNDGGDAGENESDEASNTEEAATDALSEEKEVGETDDTSDENAAK